MRARLLTAALALAVSGFAGGVLTARATMKPVEICTPELPPAQVETDLTFKVTPEPPKPRSRGEIKDFL